MIIATTSSIEGHRITEYKGLVASTAIHGINVGKDIMAAGRNLVGGRSASYEGEIDKGQSEVMHELQQAAEKLGANAVVGVSIDVEALGQAGNMLMVNMVGTAVVIE